MDDLFGVTELVKEKVHGDQEAHHAQSELHETTTATSHEKSNTAHIENDEVRAAK